MENDKWEEFVELFQKQRWGRNPVFWNKYKGITEEFAMQIPKEALYEVIYSYSVHVAGESYHEEMHRRLATMPDLLRYTFLLDRYEGEIKNGGFSQYYFNQMGYEVFEVQKALEFFGLKKHKKLLDKSLELLGQKMDLNNYIEVCSRRDLPLDKISDGLHELDHEFYNVDEDFYEIVSDYIDKHREDLVTVKPEFLDKRFPHLNRAWKKENLEVYLLMESKKKMPAKNTFEKGIQEYFSESTITSYSEEKVSFHVIYKGKPVDFDIFAAQKFQGLSDIEKSQIWKCNDAETILERNKYSVKICEVNASELTPQEKVTFEVILIMFLLMSRIYKNTNALFFEPSGRLSEVEAFYDYYMNPSEIPPMVFYMRFILNIRVFEDGHDKYVDTLGMGVLGRPDINFHFRECDINNVLCNLEPILFYLYTEDFPVKDGGSIPFSFEGCDEKTLECHYKDASCRPYREVLDITIDRSF